VTPIGRVLIFVDRAFCEQVPVQSPQ